MEKLESYMVRTPQPCVYFAISDEDQMKIYSLLSSVNKNRGPNRSERVYFKVVEKNRIKEYLDREKTWFEKTLEEPTSILYCSDWQKYKVESSKSLSGEVVSDPNMVDIISGTVGVPSNLGKEDKKRDKKDKTSDLDAQDQNLIKITSKNLEKLIREDIDEFLSPNRELNSKKTVPHKFMFLIILNKNIKNPNKVIGSLKSLDPSEVSAVCVTCGLTDITSKFEKLEQMIYETSLAYYEKKIKKINKNVLNLKSQMTGSLTEVTELFYMLQNFKIGYLSEFIGNRKEAYSKYIACWAAIKQMDTSLNLIEKTSLSFFVCLRTFDHYFFSGDVPSATSLYVEYKEYLEKLILGRYRGLYYHVMYLLNYFKAHKLEHQSLVAEKNTITNLKKASFYYRWALHYVMELRRHLSEINANEAKKESKSKKIEELFAEEEKKVKKKYHLPPNLNNIFFYEDLDYKENHDDRDYRTDESTEEELWAEDEAEEARVSESEKRLERESVELIIKNMTICKNLNYPKGLLIAYSMLGDSFYMAGNYGEALRIYLKTIKCVQYNANFNEEYGKIIKKYKKSESENDNEERETEQIDYMEVVTTLVYAELTSRGVYLGLFLKNLSKVILSLVKLLKLEKEPEVFYQLSGLVNQHSNYPEDLTGTECELEGKYKSKEEEEKRVYKLVLIKSLITFLSIYRKKNAVNKFLNHTISCFNNTIHNSPGEKNTENHFKEGLESYVLLSRNGRSQYVYKCEGDKIEIILNFKKEVKIDFSFYEGFLDTSEGQLSFYFQKSEPISEVLVIYTNDQSRETNDNNHDFNSDNCESNVNNFARDDNSSTDKNDGDDYDKTVIADEGKLVEIPYNIRIIMIVQLPFYPVKDFKINGVILKGRSREGLDLNGIMLTQKYVINNYFKMLDNIVNLGYYTSKFDLEKHFANKFNRYEEDSEKLVNLMYLSLNLGEEARRPRLKRWINVDKLELMKILNVNMKQKIFIKNLVRNSMAPIILVFIFNRKFAHLYESYKYQLKVTNNEFYVFGKRGGNFVLHGSDKIEFDFRESIYEMEGEEVTKNIKLSRLDEQPRHVLYKKKEIKQVNERGEMSESDNDLEKEIDPELRKYMEIYKNNNKIFVMFGLISIGGAVTQSLINFNLFIKNFQITNDLVNSNDNSSTITTDNNNDSNDNNNNNTNNNKNSNNNDNDETEHISDRDKNDTVDKDNKDVVILFQTKSVEMESSSMINVSVKHQIIGNSDVILLINLNNSSNIVYDLAAFNILYNNKLLKIEDRLYGFKSEIGPFQNMNLIYLIKDYKQHNIKRGENVVQIQVTEHIRQELNYPFKYMRQFLKHTINKFVKIEDEGSSKIELEISHSSIVELGRPFQMEAVITNITNETMEYEISLVDENKAKERPFVLEGPVSRSVVALPRSTDRLHWTIVATRCVNFRVPVVRVVNKLDSSKKTEVRSRASQIYVVP